jgi:hypothetical protein
MGAPYGLSLLLPSASIGTAQFTARANPVRLNLLDDLDAARPPRRKPASLLSVDLAIVDIVASLNSGVCAIVSVPPDGMAPDIWWLLGFVRPLQPLAGIGLSIWMISIGEMAQPSL